MCKGLYTLYLRDLNNEQQKEIKSLIQEDGKPEVKRALEKGDDIEIGKVYDVGDYTTRG